MLLTLAAGPGPFRHPGRAPAGSPGSAPCHGLAARPCRLAGPAQACRPHRIRHRPTSVSASAADEFITESDAVMIERTIGTMTFMEERRSSGAEALSSSFEPAEMSIRLLSGRIVQGPLANTRVTIKVYPSRLTGEGGRQADALAANELRSHLSLQPPAAPNGSPRMCKLLGAFATSAASGEEQYLLYRADGTTTAAAYAQMAAAATKGRKAVGEGDIFDYLDPKRPLARRRRFVCEILAQALDGLAFMHRRDRLHQSIGAASLLLSTVDERDTATLQVRLWDLAFSADVSREALVGGSTLADVFESSRVDAPRDAAARLSEGLWQRAEADGCRTAAERRAFGIADDMYAAGLLMAHMTIVPLAEPGSVDGPATLTRLVGLLARGMGPTSAETGEEIIAPFRDYVAADEAWLEGARFLNERGGWGLLGEMVHPNWRRRPGADAVINHPFIRDRKFSIE